MSVDLETSFGNLDGILRKASIEYRIVFTLHSTDHKPMDTCLYVQSECIPELETVYNDVYDALAELGSHNFTVSTMRDVSTIPKGMNLITASYTQYTRKH